MEFKLFLKLEHKEEEVRRFSCYETIDYQEFRCLVRKAFERLPGDDFVLKWEDEDGDKVAISSEKEFKFAVTHLKISAEVFRVDVEIFDNPWWKQIQRSNERTWANCKGEEHSGISCCCCQQQVRGFRYKCLACTSFDICGACEDKGMHPKHDMIRISNERRYQPGLLEKITSLYKSTPVEDGHVSSEDVPAENSLTDVKAEDVTMNGSFNSQSTKSEIKDNELKEEEHTSFYSNGKNKHEISMEDTEEPVVENATNYDSPDKEELDDNIPEVETKINGAETIFQNYSNSVVQLDQEPHENDEDAKAVTTNHLISNDIICINLTKEELKGFETNKDEYNVESCPPKESFRSVHEEIESLLAPMTPLPDLESVNNVMKINKSNNTDTNKEMYSPGEVSSLENDEFDNKIDISKEDNKPTGFNDKKSKDRENSAIASSTHFENITIHSCLEDSLSKMEDSMKITSTKIGEYGENDKSCTQDTKELAGSRLFIFLKVLSNQ